LWSALRPSARALLGTVPIWVKIPSMAGQCVGSASSTWQGRLGLRVPGETNVSELKLTAATTRCHQTLNQDSIWSPVAGFQDSSSVQGSSSWCWPRIEGRSRRSWKEGLQHAAPKQKWEIGMDSALHTRPQGPRVGQIASRSRRRLWFTPLGT
jgi:hypothetical protein